MCGRVEEKLCVEIIGVLLDGTVSVPGGRAGFEGQAFYLVCCARTGAELHESFDMIVPMSHSTDFFTGQLQ